MNTTTTKKNPAGLRTCALGLAACATLASGLAAADDSNWYVGANAGVSHARIDDARISSALLGSGFASTSIVDDERGTGFKVFGGYQFTPNFALEAGYFDLGRFGFDATTVPAGTFNGRIKLRGVNLDLVARLPITQQLSAFARVGVNRAEARDTFTGTGAVRVLDPSPHTRATNYKFGGGLQYDFTPSLGMRLEAERYRINDAVGNKGDINLYTVGLVYRFGQAGRPIAPAVAMVAAPVPAPAPVAVVAAPVPVMAPAPVRVAFSADALFDFNRATLKPAGKAALDRFVAELGGARIDTLKVTGHTDRIGGHAYNLKLSASRAEAVKAYLVAPGGIAANAIMATGVDGAQPVTKPGDCKGSKPTPALIACLAPDRRVEVEVTATK